MTPTLQLFTRALLTPDLSFKTLADARAATGADGLPRLMRTTRFAEQRSSRSGTYGHPPHLLPDQLGMADHLYRQTLLDTVHKIPHRHGLRQFANHPEADPPVRRIGRLQHP